MIKIDYNNDSSVLKEASILSFVTSAISETFMTGTNLDANVNSKQNKATPAESNAYSTHVAE